MVVCINIGKHAHFILIYIDNGPIISLNMDSLAIIRPVPIGTSSPKPKASLDICPKETCIMKRISSRTRMIQCEKCQQWFHFRCAGVSTYKAAKKDFDFFCSNCKN